MHEMERRFHDFAMSLPGSESIDELGLDTAKGQRADYLWRQRSVVVEVKRLKGDPQDKIDKMVDELSAREDFPIFFGSVPADKVLGRLSDGDKLLAKLQERVLRSVEAAFRDARDQVVSTKTLLGLNDAVGVMVILNPDIEALDPNVVGQFISRLMVHRQSNEHSIDVVWLISEAHFVGDAQPCVLIEHTKLARFEWSQAWISQLNELWSRYNNSPVRYSHEPLLSNLKFERKSDRQVGPLTNEQRWRKSYHVHRYLADMDDNSLRAFGSKVMAEMLPYFLIDGPHPRGTLPPERLMVSWAHFLEEAASRGLDMRGMGPSAIS